jgi:hypothetical protein
MNLFFLHLPAKNRGDESGKNTLVSIQGPEHNTTEGSEFLDDAIRMQDQPLMYTEESAASGYPESLL